MLLTIGLWGSWSNSAPHISHPSWTSMYISLMTVAEAHANKQKHVIPLKALAWNWHALTSTHFYIGQNIM